MKHGMRNGFWALVVFGLTLAAPGAAQAGGPRNLNFAAFHKVAKNFAFEPGVTGKFADFIQAMEGSQILLLSHTSDAVDGDVINIQQDVLRENKGALGDYGINCQISFRDASTPDTPSYKVGGLCKIIQVGNGKNLKLSAIIPMADVPDTSQGVDVWMKVYEDEKTGIAFYANVSK